MVQVFLQVIRLSFASIIPPILRTHLRLNVALTGTKGRPLETVQ